MNQEHRIKEFRWEENGELTLILDNGIQIKNARITALNLFEPDKTKNESNSDNIVQFTKSGYVTNPWLEERYRKYICSFRKIWKDRESNTGGSNE